MASLVPEVENWTCINGCNNDDLSNFDHSQIDCSLLMSLLDDSQSVDDIDHDNERLSSVIRSLEAEIDDQHLINIDQSSHQGSTNGEDWQSWESDQSQSQEFLESDHLDMNWMDIEMEIPPPNSISDDLMNFWYMDNNSYGQDHHESHDVYEYGYGAFPLEENDHNSSTLITQG